MWMAREFKTAVAAKTDGQLYEVLAHAEDYVPEAIAAAHAEVQRRHLTPERGAQLEALAQAGKAEETRMAGEPLRWISRILLLLMPGMVVFFAAFYLSRGYHAREDQCWLWAVGGLGGRLVLAVVLGGSALLNGRPGPIGNAPILLSPKSWSQLNDHESRPAIPAVVADG